MPCNSHVNGESSLLSTACPGVTAYAGTLYCGCMFPNEIRQSFHIISHFVDCFTAGKRTFI